MNYQKLKKHPLFHGIPEADFPEMLDGLIHRLHQYQRGDMVLSYGDSLSEIGFLLSGQLIVISESEEGSNNIVQNILPNQIFGEALTASRTEESPFSIYCLEDSEVFYLQYQNLIDGINNRYHQQLIANLTNLRANKIMRMNYHLIVTSRRKLRHKLLAYLYLQKAINHNSTFTISLNREQLAAYLFVDRSALSYVLMKLKSEGVLDYYRNSFTLK